MSQTSIAGKLPNEIVYMILQCFDSVTIAKFELVCKQWKNVARSSKSLWRDASLVQGKDIRNYEMSIDHIMKRIEILGKRAGGSLDHLSISLHTEVQPFSGGKGFNEMISKGLKTLRLSLQPEFIFQFENGNWVMRFDFYSAIARCTSLKSLQLQIPILTLKQELSSQAMKIKDDTPILQCKLEKLSLIGIEHYIFLPEGGLLNMLSQARIIVIKSEYPMSEESALNLFEAAKDTLQVIHLYVKDRQTSSNPITKRIHLPALLLLSLRFAERENGGVLHIFHNVSFHWPNLKDVRLEGQTSSSFYENIFTGSLKRLYIKIGIRRVRLIKPKQFVMLLTRCTSLETLGLAEFRSDIEAILKEIRFNAITIPIKILTIVDGSFEGGDELVSLVRERNKESATGFLGLQIQHSLKLNVTHGNLSWLRENVKTFRCDRISSFPPLMGFPSIDSTFL